MLRRLDEEADTNIIIGVGDELARDSTDSRRWTIRGFPRFVSLLQSSRQRMRFETSAMEHAIAKRMEWVALVGDECGKARHFGSVVHRKPAERAFHASDEHRHRSGIGAKAKDLPPFQDVGMALAESLKGCPIGCRSTRRHGSVWMSVADDSRNLSSHVDASGATRH